MFERTGFRGIIKSLMVTLNKVIIKLIINLINYRTVNELQRNKLFSYKLINKD